MRVTVASCVTLLHDHVGLVSVRPRIHTTRVRRFHARERSLQPEACSLHIFPGEAHVMLAFGCAVPAKKGKHFEPIS